MHYDIELRDPGDPTDPTVGWQRVATVDEPTAAMAIICWCNHNSWTHVRLHNHLATVPGVGMFRAMPGEALAQHAFVVQRQAPPGPDERHITWLDVDTVTASDPAAAITLYCERWKLESVAVSGSTFRPYGLGLFRIVPAEHADHMRITPAP